MLFPALNYFQKARVLAPELNAKVFCQTEVELLLADIKVGSTPKEILFGFEGYLNVSKLRFSFSL